MSQPALHVLVKLQWLQALQKGMQSMHAIPKTNTILSFIRTLVPTNYYLPTSTLYQDLEEVTVAKNEAEDTIYDLEDRLEMVIASHAATSNKLQLSTLLLQVNLYESVMRGAALLTLIHQS